MSEQIYDKQISPLLEKIYGICKDNNISFNALFQYGPKNEDHCSVIFNNENQPESTKMFISRAAIQSQANIDALFIAIKKHSNVVGHNSIVLSMMEKENA
jgi:hypothetical protein